MTGFSFSFDDIFQENYKIKSTPSRAREKKDSLQNKFRTFLEALRRSVTKLFESH